MTSKAKRAVFPGVLSLLLFLAPTLRALPAEPNDGGELVVDATKSVIPVGLRYNGDRIDFFGTFQGTEADALIVKLTSPAETVKLNIKGRVGPFWMNTKQYEVENVPSMYQVQASDRLDRILTPELARQIGVGFETLRERLKFRILKGEPEEGDPETLFEGILRIKKEAGLYSIDDSGVIRMKKGKLFSHYFDFPSTAKPGTYTVTYYLIRDGALVGTSSESIQIRKVGVEAFVERAARERPVLYGICAVLIALATGLLVGLVFKGSAH